MNCWRYWQLAGWEAAAAAAAAADDDDDDDDNDDDDDDGEGIGDDSCTFTTVRIQAVRPHSRQFS